MKLRRLFFFSLIALGALVIGACSSGAPAEPTRAMTPGAEAVVQPVETAHGAPPVVGEKSRAARGVP